MNLLRYLVYLALILATVSACGEIKVVLEVKLDGINEYFQAYCIAQYPQYNKAQIETCTNESNGTFLKEMEF